MKTFEILSNHDIYVDHYENGEGDRVNYFELKSTHIATDYKEAVNKHLSKYGYNLGIENCEIDTDCNRLQTSCLVDEDNTQPTNSDIKEWEQNKKVLYADNISISVCELVEVKL